MSSDSNNTRWKVLNTGQVVDTANLAEDIAKLQIGEGADVEGRLSTPPQGKRAPVVLQVQETSPLETGSDNSGSPTQDGLGLPHSRESSGDTASSQESLSRQPLKVNTLSEKDRPHSFSGGLSSLDMARLQQAGGSVANGMSPATTTPIGRPQLSSPLAEQPSYATLATHHQPKSRQQDFSRQNFQVPVPSQRGDMEYQQARQFASHPQPGAPPFIPSGSRPGVDGPAMLPYRQATRSVYSQPMMQGNPGMPSNFPYTPGHHPHMSMNNPQQLYDMMLPDHTLNVAAAAVAAAQQQAAFRSGGHQHSASDPATLRDAAALALLGGAGFPQAVGAGMYPPPQALSMYAAAAAANPFYPAAQRDAYAQAQEMARAMQQLQPQYTGMSGYDSAPQSPPASSTHGGPSNGPSANNRKLGLYKTELCRSWEEKGSCRYGQKCQFAHGEEEIRNVPRHPKYKTEICRTFWVSGSCPYGKRCCFIHTELPSSGHPPGADGTPPPQNLDAHTRPTSTNSDPEQPPVSLLQRISAQRNQENGSNTPTSNGPTSANTPKTSSPPSAGIGSMTRPGSLRVDTSSLDASVSMKQNKSAYPTFAANGVLMPGDAPARSPGPVTAGPEFGQQSRLRGEVVGRFSSRSPVNSSVRHSFNGDGNLITSPVSASGTGPSFAAGIQTSGVPASAVDNSAYSLPRVQGHTRSGSAGNWKGFTARGSHLAPPSPYSHSPSPNNDNGGGNSSAAWPPSSDLSSNAAARSKENSNNNAWM